MKFNKWTVALAAAGLVSIGHNAQAEEGFISALSKTTLSGFVDTSFSLSNGHTGLLDTSNGPVEYLPGRVLYQNEQKMDGFNLDVIQLSLSSPMDESDWAAGYQADLLLGPDAPFYSGSANQLMALGTGGDLGSSASDMAVRAANGLIAANFGASGQSCVAGSRGLIHRSILPELIARIKDKASGIVVGDPLNTATHVGPLCTGAQIDRIVDTLDKAQSQGATIHFGGAPLERDGNYMAPTLVECPSEDTETLHIEMFGPVMSLIPFDTEEEAIMMANNSQFGLGSGVFTQNIARAHRVSDRIRSGICWVNTYRAISPIAPFGGFNQSGYGREAGQDAILDYTRTKTTWINTSDAPMLNPFVMR